MCVPKKTYRWLRFCIRFLEIPVKKKWGSRSENWVYILPFIYNVFSLHTFLLLLQRRLYFRSFKSLFIPFYGMLENIIHIYWLWSGFKCHNIEHDHQFSSMCVCICAALVLIESIYLHRWWRWWREMRWIWYNFDFGYDNTRWFLL